ncbi:metallophosphoesterase [Tsuneonella sp. HG094]
MNILHISDLHAGMANSDWIWPNLQKAFKDDLRRLLDDEGGLDLTIFTGDLTQRGTEAEFDKAAEIISEINSIANEFGEKPKLVTLPGNHDLLRPKANTQISYALKAFTSSPNTLDNFLDSTGEMVEPISLLFSAYTSFLEKAKGELCHLDPYQVGILPGDCSYIFSAGGQEIGLITLNSTWQQVDESKYEKRLFVDPRQLLAVTDSQPDNWLSGREVNLVATHHPSEWLSTTGLEAWQDDIASPGRFSAHLFGHMHEHRMVRTSTGGSAPRTSIQAASLLGLERIGNGLQRTHGYSLIQILPENSRILPRAVVSLSGGGRQFGPDLTQGLVQDRFLPLHFAGQPVDASIEATRFDPLREIGGTFNLQVYEYHLAGSAAHRAVRKHELDEAISALKLDGVVWVESEWGKGDEGFLAAVKHQKFGRSGITYRISLEGIGSPEDFYERFRLENRVEFAVVCESLSRTEDHILILDNIFPDPTEGSKPDTSDVGAETLARFIRQYSPSSNIVLRGRPTTDHLHFARIRLESLDEADTADYLLNHEYGQSKFARDPILAKIWQATGGLPEKIDSFLSELKVTSLDDLLRQERHSGLATPFAAAAPDTFLRQSIVDLKTSKTPVLQRANSLLEALSVLPQGEQLPRLKRFYGASGLYSNHALELAGRRLIDTTPLLGGKVAQQDDEKKALIVPKVVREEVLSSLNQRRRQTLDDAALRLYFGDDWRTGDISKSIASRNCKDPLCEPYEIMNCSAIIVRALTKAAAEGGGARTTQLVYLASSFIAALGRGNHYRASVDFADEVLALVPEDSFLQQIDVIKFQKARSLRMLGETEDAQRIFAEIDPAHLSADQKRSVDLNMALMCEKAGDQEGAREFANKVLRKGKTDGYGFQAQQILVEQEESPQAVLEGLRAIQTKARQKKCYVAANNAAMTISELTKDKAERAELLQTVLKSGSTQNDFHNATRATLRILRSAGGANPSEQIVSFLIKIYEHLFNERSSNLFDECHEQLWKVFGKSRDLENLLRLFRYSSFTWRIRGDSSQELRYLTDLRSILSAVSSSNLSDVAREMKYFETRSNDEGTAKELSG